MLAAAAELGGGSYPAEASDSQPKATTGYRPEPFIGQLFEFGARAGLSHNQVQSDIKTLLAHYVRRGPRNVNSTYFPEPTEIRRLKQIYHVLDRTNQDPKAVTLSRLAISFPWTVASLAHAGTCELWLTEYPKSLSKAFIFSGTAGCIPRTILDVGAIMFVMDAVTFMRCKEYRHPIHPMQERAAVFRAGFFHGITPESIRREVMRQLDVITPDGRFTKSFEGAVYYLLENHERLTGFSIQENMNMPDSRWFRIPLSCYTNATPVNQLAVVPSGGSNSGDATATDTPTNADPRTSHKLNDALMMYSSSAV